MLSPEETAAINAEIEKLKQARHDCRDSGLLNVIDAWIEYHKRKLEVAPQNEVVPTEQRDDSANPK